MNQAWKVLVRSALAAGWFFIPLEARCRDVPPEGVVWVNVGEGIQQDIQDIADKLTLLQGAVVLNEGRIIGWDGGPIEGVQIWDLAQVKTRALSGGYGRGFLPLPKEGERPKVEADTAHLRNGDKLSGVIEGISGGFLSIRSELLPGPGGVKIPLENVLQILFKEKEGSSQEREARAVFANGDRLRVNVKAYDGETVVAETQFSEQVQIRKQHVSGVVFRREPRIIYQGDFEGEDFCGFKELRCYWGVSDGKLGPLSDPDSAAYLKLRQEGHVRYEWEVSSEARNIRQARFYFFAQAADHHAPGNAYRVDTSGRSVYVYRTIQNNVQHVAAAAVQSGETSRKFEVDYDSGRGTFRLKVNGEEVVAGVFSPAIARGEYIIVTAQSKDRFDNIRVRQVMDTLLPAGEEKSEGKDCVSLVNGDRLSGKVALISEGNLRMETGYCEEPLDVPVEEVWSVRFGGATAKQGEKLATLSLRNGDRLNGEVICLEESSLRVRSPYLGDVAVDVNDVAWVVFPGEEGVVEPEETENVERDFPGPLPWTSIQVGPGEVIVGPHGEFINIGGG